MKVAMSVIEVKNICQSADNVGLTLLEALCVAHVLYKLSKVT